MITTTPITTPAIAPGGKLLPPLVDAAAVVDNVAAAVDVVDVAEDVVEELLVFDARSSSDGKSSPGWSM